MAHLEHHDDHRSAGHTGVERYDTIEEFGIKVKVPYFDDPEKSIDPFENTLKRHISGTIAAIENSTPNANQRFIHRLIDGLTPNQLAAVSHSGSPLLVLAGAGTGKTRVLTTRIATIIAAGIAQPENILALTFTNKAAKEMSDRIGRLLNPKIKSSDADAVVRDLPPIANITACTFHAFAARMLREFGGEISMTTDWTIMDGDESRRLLKKCWIAATGQKPEDNTVDELDNANQTIARSQDPIGELYKLPDDIQSAIRYYKAEKETQNIKDFGDIIADFQHLLESENQILATIRQRYTHVLVDEFQDTDFQQAHLLHLLTDGNPNLTVVGDDDQVLYTWRQARIENILGFTDDFSADIIRLEDNFRSTANILKFANRLIAANNMRLGKTLVTKAPAGKAVAYANFSNAFDESRWIVSEIAKLIAKGVDPENIAVLSRASHVLNLFEMFLNERGIRYTLSGGKKFQDRQEIKDISAYLRIIANAADRVAFERAVAAPKRGVGPAIIEQITQVSKNIKTSFIDASRRLARGEMVPTNVRGPLEEFADTIDSISADAIHGADGFTIVSRIVDDTGYRAELLKELEIAKSEQEDDKIAQIDTRLKNIQDLAGIGRGKSLHAFLDHLGLSEDTKRDDSKGIWIGTIHAAKGLEFPHVYLPAWEEQILPSRQSLQDPHKLEEERRAAYVAITRAMTELTLTWADQRFTSREEADSEPSRFLHDLGIMQALGLSSPATQKAYANAHTPPTPVTAAPVSHAPKPAPEFEMLDDEIPW